MYIVEEGQLKTTTCSADGKQCLLAIHTPGDTFGELGLLGGARQETATAMKDSVLRQMNSARFFSQLVNDDHLAWCFTRFLMQRLLDQQETITQLVTMDSEHRLAATLLRIAQKLGRRLPDKVQIDAKITQEDLASMVGTTRSRVGLFLKNFREAGLVGQLPGGYLLINEAALAGYVEEGLGAALRNGTARPVPQQRNPPPRQRPATTGTRPSGQRAGLLAAQSGAW